MFYSRIAVAKKNMKVNIYAHTSEDLYNDNNDEKFARKSPDLNNTGYFLIYDYAPQKESIRNILWRPGWGTIS